MHTQKKSNPFNSYSFSDPTKPKADRDVKVTLSQFNAACLVIGHYNATVSQIMKAIKHKNNGAVRITREELTERLNNACEAGYLDYKDGAYEFTGDGITVARAENKSTGWKYKPRRCKVGYIGIPK